MLGFEQMAEKRKEPEPTKGRPLALDPLDETNSHTESAFIAKPEGAPVYHHFEILHDVVVAGFPSGKSPISRLKLVTKATPLLLRPITAGQDWCGRFRTNPTLKRLPRPKRSDGEFG